MADKQIISIPIDTSQWDAFVDSWNSWNKQLEKNGDAWTGANAGIKAQKSAWDDVEKSFDSLVKVSTADKFSGQTNGVFARVNKDGKETAKSWISISKEIDRAGRNMSGLLRDGSRFTALGSLFGIGGVAALGAGVFGAVRGADNSLANENLLNRKLNLKPGEEQAFTNVYEKAGGDDALLHRVNAAKNDPSQWPLFAALGIPQNDVRTKGTAELSTEVLEHGGQQWAARGASAGLWAKQLGLDSFVGNENMQAASTRLGEFGELNKQFHALIPTLAATDKQLEDATKARQALDADTAKNALALKVALEGLNPEVIHADDAFTNAATAFLKSDDVKNGLELLADGLDEAVPALTKLNNWLTKQPLKPIEKDFVHTADKAPAETKAALEKLKKSGWDWRHPWDSLDKNLFDANAKPWWARDADYPGSNGSNGSNNPGNLEVPNKHGQFQQFDNPDAGVLAMDRQLMLYAQRDHLDTLQGIIGKYAPAADGNDDAAYVRDVAGRTGFDPIKPLDMNDPKVRAAVEAAMIRHESGKKYSQFDQQAVLDLISGKTLPDSAGSPQKTAFEKHAKTDDPMNDPRIMPMDEVDKKAIAAQSTTDKTHAADAFTDRMMRAAQMLRDGLQPGGGSQFAMPDQQRKPLPSTAQAPIQTNIVVTVPPGANTTTTFGTLVQ